jgi:hypothetical protein
VLLDWDIGQVDIDTAFLYGDIDSEIYVEVPAGPFADFPDRTTMVCRLPKPHYGLKQAPKIWLDTLRKALEEMGFNRRDTDHSVYVLWQRRSTKAPSAYVTNRTPCTSGGGLHYTT